MRSIVVSMIGATALLAAPMSFAKDINVGTIAVGGGFDAGYSSGTISPKGGGGDVDTSSMGLSGDGMYYFMKNLGAGLILSYNSDEQKAGSVTTKDSSTMYGLGVQYDYGINNDLNARVKAGYLMGSSSSDNGTTKTDTDMSSFLVGVGVAYFLNNNVSLDAGFQYTSTAVKDAYDMSDMGLTVGLSVYLGK